MTYQEIPYVPPALLARNGRHPIDDSDTTQEDPEVLRQVRLTPASQVRMRMCKWAWDTAAPDAHPSKREGRIPVGSLVIAAGRADLGKSQVACWLAAQVTRGVLPGAWRGRPRNVVYAASEDSWEMTLAPRLTAAGADLDRVFQVDVVDHLLTRATKLTVPKDVSGLERRIKENDVVMVVMDPMLSLIDDGIDDYRAKEVRAALEPLGAMADRTGAVMLAIAHFTKGSGDPLHLIGGSAAFGQLIRAGLGFAEMETAADGGELDEPRFVMSTIKNNLGRKDLPSLEYRIESAPVAVMDGESWVSRVSFTGEPCHVSVQMMMAGQDPRREAEEERDEAVEWLRGYLIDMGGEAAAADVLKAGMVAGGWSNKVLHRARKKVGVVSRKAPNRGLHGPWMWTLSVIGEGQEAQEAQEAPFLKPGNLGLLGSDAGFLPTESEGW